MPAFVPRGRAALGRVHGDAVPRQYLQVIAGDKREPFKQAQKAQVARKMSTREGVDFWGIG